MDYSEISTGDFTIVYSQTTQAKLGDEVVIIGEQAGKSITVHELGSWMASLCYDQLTAWSKRMETKII